MQKTKINKKIISVDGITRRKKIPQISGVEYGTKPKNAVFYSGLKMTGMFLAALAVFVGLSSVGSTVSYFNDVESSIGNYLRADPLSFSVSTGSSAPLQIDLSSDDRSIALVMSPGNDSEPIQYFVTAIKTGGDDALCNAINLLAEQPFPYSGPMFSLQTGTSTNIGSWGITFSVPDANLFSNTSCTIDLVYKGWNDGVPFGKGYNDTQTISLTFFIPGVSAASVITASTAETTEILASSTESSITLQSTTTEATTTEPVILPSEQSVNTSTTIDYVADIETITSPSTEPLQPPTLELAPDPEPTPESDQDLSTQ